MEVIVEYEKPETTKAIFELIKEQIQIIISTMANIKEWAETINDRANTEKIATAIATILDIADTETELISKLELAQAKSIIVKLARAYVRVSYSYSSISPIAITLQLATKKIVSTVPKDYLIESVKILDKDKRLKLGYMNNSRGKLVNADRYLLKIFKQMISTS